MHRESILPLVVTVLLAFCVEGSADLVGHWPLDEGTGGQVTDATGGGHDGTINGATWASPGWNGEGTCLQFDGVNDVVEVPHADDLRFGANSAYTVAAWVNMTVRPGHWSGIVTKGRETGNWYGIWVDPSNQWIFGHQPNNQAGSQVEPGVWVHVAMVYSNANKKIYLNGKLDNETTASASGDNIGDLWFGAAKGVTEFAPASIDDIRIYNHALSPAEIKALIPPKLKADNPTPADGAIGVTMPLLQWTKGDTAVFHNVYLGTSPDLTEADRAASQQPFPMLYLVQGLQPGTTYFWRVDEVEAGGTVHTGHLWSFTTEPLKAYSPKPADSSMDLFPASILRWLPGKAAVQHQVYFSSNLSDVEAGAPAADKGKVTETTFTPGVLRASTTYYWRVDEVKADGSVEPGLIWSFSTADGVTGKIARQWWLNVDGTAISALTSSPDYPDRPTGAELTDTFEGPVDWADNYGTRFYGWLTPPQAGDYTFWISGDDASELWLSTDIDPAAATVIARVASWTDSREWTKEAGQKSAAIALQAGRKYFIQALSKEGTGGDNIAVSWQGPGVAAQEIITGQYMDTFALPPLQAFSPSPSNGDAEASQSGLLIWSAGEKAAQHEVYFGDDRAAIAAADTSSPLFQGRQAGTTYNAGDLEWGKTYYWRVDEINTAEADSPWKGPVWSFTTADFIPIDNMETYTDDEGSRIYETWIDGWTNNTGSTVGYVQAPFAERAIVHGGRQSMPLDYNNVNPPYYSEAEREFSATQNWTVNGVDAVTLFLRGVATNGAGRLYVAIEDSTGKVAAVASNAPLTSTTWTAVPFPLSQFTGVNLSRVKVLYLGIGDRSAPAKGGAGLVYIDDIRVTRP